MKKHLLLTLALILSTTVLTLHAQNWNEIINATASDAAASDTFGFSVAIDGDYAIVGAYFNDDDGTDSGSAYVFERTGSTWAEQTKLTASDATASDWFGSSVAISGDYAIVGAPRNDDNGTNSGSAYVFTRTGSTWTQQGKLTASDAALGDQFGFRVSISGDYAIIGASGNDDNGTDSGSAYVFARTGSTWIQQSKLTASDAASLDRFGNSVAISGDYAIVGAEFNDDNGSSSGSAYVFMRIGTTWTEQAKLTASDAAGGDTFGRVAIDGDTAIVGAYRSDDNGSESGSAYVYTRTGSIWTEQAKLTASDAAGGDRFGISVAIDGDNVIVGAYFNDDDGTDSGSAYVFARTGSTWSEQTKLIASDATASDWFGSSVAISGDYAIVGAYLNDDAGSDSGSAYFFEKVAITADLANLPDITAQCEATPTVPTANSGVITATADVTFPITTQGTTIVTWTYDDGIGNALTQTQTVIINDTTAPNLSFVNPSDAIIESCTNEVTVPSPIATDDCPSNQYALDFDGIDDWVTVSSTIDSFKTIEFWLYTENGIFGDEPFEYVFSWNNSNLKYIATGGFSSSYTNETISMVTNFGQIMTTFEDIPAGWNHIAFTGNGSSFDTILINGVSVPVVNDGFPQVFTATPTEMGRNAATTDGRLNGKLDEVRFWDTARTVQEITDNYTETIDPANVDLLAYYNFEDGPGSSILADQTANGADGALTNMDPATDWVNDSAPVNGVILTNDFNGTADASGTYPVGPTIVTWTATDASGNQTILEQIVDIDCGITFTFNNGIWTPSDPNGTAVAEDDLVIASGDALINTNTTCNSVRVNPGAGLSVDAGATLTTANGLTLESNSTSYSSLILDGTVTGTMSYERHVNTNGSGTTGSNDLVSAPLTGQTFNTFAAANPNIFSNTAGDLFLFGPFDKTTGNYITYSDTETAILNAGVGYRAATSDNSTVTFTGIAENGLVTNNIVNSGPIRQEWNLVGNPYPSYLNVQEFLGHDVGGVTNIQLFDAPTAAIYGYDGNAQNGWTVYNLANTTASTLIAPGQGFFVSADAINSGSYDLEFTPAMRSTGNGDDFIVGRNVELIYLKLNLSSETNTYKTEFYFNTNASEGLDQGYDAEMFEGTNSEFSLYSHLLQDNEGKPIALQTLNSTNITNVSIPLGVNASQGEQITFSINESTLPNTVNVYLDDVLTNTTTLLNTSDYIITPATNASGTGRFFLRTSEDALSTIDYNLETLNIFALNSSKEVVVSGLLQESTNLELYDIQGRVVFTRALDVTALENRVDVSSLSSGVYVIRVNNNVQSKTQKVILK
jgi:hypothetical protein